jgi:excisionase family DNA binding protein
MTPHEIATLAALIAEHVAARLSSTSNGDCWLDKEEAAELLGCSVSTIERGTRTGEIPSAKVAGLRRYLRSKLLALSEADNRGEE